MIRASHLATLVLLACGTPRYYMQDCTADPCLNEELECADTMYPHMAPARVCKLPCQADFDCPAGVQPTGTLNVGPGDPAPSCAADGYCVESNTYWERST